MHVGKIVKKKMHVCMLLTAPHRHAIEKNATTWQRRRPREASRHCDARKRTNRENGILHSTKVVARSL